MAQPAAPHDPLLDREVPWTEEDFLALPEDRRIELVDGSLLVSPYAGRRHQRMSMRLGMALDGAAPAEFEVFEAINVRVGAQRVLIPDLAVLTDPGTADVDDVVIDARFVALVVEIVSPSSVAMDRAIKPPLYAAAGVPHYLRIEGTSGVAYALRDGRYEETARAAAGEPLSLVEPFPVTLDLSALVRRPQA